MRLPTITSVFRRLVPLAAVALAACDSTRAELSAPASPISSSASALAADGSLPAEGAFLVGNFDPAPGGTTGILRYDARGRFVDVFAPAGRGGLTVACCLAYGPDDNLYVGSPFTSSILRYDGATGAFLGEFVPTGSGGLTLPVVIAFGPDGNLYVGDFGPGFARPAVRRYDGRTGAFIDVFVQPNAGGMIAANDPQHFDWGPDGNFYLAAPVAGKVLRFDGRTGEFIDAFVSNAAGRPRIAGGLVFGGDGALYVGAEGAVLRFDARTGAYRDTFVRAGSGGLDGTVGILFGPDGHLYVADFLRGGVLRFDGMTGAFIDEFIPRGRGPIGGPRMIAFKLKLRVCHRAPEGADGGRTLSVGQLDAADHVAHGDHVGSCH